MLMDKYVKLVDSGVPHYEARQILPIGMENN